MVDNILINAPSPEPQRQDARHRHEEDEACGREKPAGIAEIHFLAGDGLFPDEPAPCPDGLTTGCERLTVRAVYSLFTYFL